MENTLTKSCFFTNKNGQLYILKEHKYLFSKPYFWKLAKGDQGTYLIFPNEFSYNWFKNTFEVPKECICIVKKYANNKNFFVSVENDGAEIIQKGTILSRKNGVMGTGIYCLQEEDFEPNIEDFNLLANYNNMDRWTNDLHINFNKEENLVKKNTSIVFRYTGPYFECVNGEFLGESLSGLIKIEKKGISLDYFLHIISEYVEMVTEEVAGV